MLSAPASAPLDGPSGASILVLSDGFAEVEAALSSLGARIVRALSEEEAVRAIAREDFAIVVADTELDSGGLSEAVRARAGDADRILGVLHLGSALRPPREVDVAFGRDLLGKPIDAALLRGRVAPFIALHRAQRQLRERAARLEAQERMAAARHAALLDAALDAVVGMDHRGSITEFNAAAEAMFGWRREEVIGRSMAEHIVPPQYRESHRRGLERYLATGQGSVLSRRVEIEAQRADGSVFPVELAISRVGSDDPATFVAYIRDISAQQRAGRERTELLDRLRLALDAADVGTWDWNVSTGVVTLDERCRELLGVPADADGSYELFTSAVHPEDQDRVREGIQRLLDPALHGVYRAEFRAASAPGATERWISSRGRAFFDGEGRAQRVLGTLMDATARRNVEVERAHLLAQAEQASADAEIERARLHALLTELPAFIAIQRGPEHVYEFANARYRALVGQRVLDDKPLRQVFPELAAQGIYELLDRVLATGETLTVPELRAELPFGGDGSPREGYFNVVLQPVVGIDGRAEGVMTFAYEVTEQVRGRQLLETAEAKFRRIFESNMIGFVFSAGDGRVLDANDYVLSMLGFTRQELRAGAIRWDVLTPPEYRAVSARAIEQLRTSEVSAQFEKEYVRKDGTRVPVVLGSARLPADVGGAEFATFLLDISDRKALERERERARHQLQVILDAAGEGIYGLDAGGRTTFVNPSAARMLGYEPEQLRGQVQHELVHHTRPDGSGYPRSECPIHVALRDGTVHRRDDEVFWRKDGTSFPVEYTSTPITDGDRTLGAVVVFHDITERKRAEAARDFLAQASEAFAASLDYEATLQTVVRLAVPRIADWCAVEVTSDDPRETVRLAVAHTDPAKVALAEELRRRYPPDPDAAHGVPQVLRSGRSELYELVSDALLERGARDAEHLRILREAGLRSAMIVPLMTHGRALGAITFVLAESGRRYAAADLATAEELARRAAIAIENAELYRASQAAEARNRFLSEATEALASSLDYTTTLERVARLAVPAVADTAALYRLENDGSLRLGTLVAKDPAWEELARELDALLPLHLDHQDRLLPRVVKSGRGEVLTDVPESTRGVWRPTSRAADILKKLQIRSYMAVPFVVRGRVLGALALTSSGGKRRLGPEDLALAHELARRAGLAVENAELYREAQEANRLKDEFLATVSHELRTPLTAILGWTHLLRTGRPTQVARALDTIERNAHAQARIIEDVLDVSRIITGKLGLELQRVNPADVVQAAVDTVRPAAEAKAIELVTTLDPAAGDAVGDPARLQQVVWNLLSNAIKFTPKGGRVEVRLERSEADLRLAVSDTGQGIRADFLPHVFERFRQADSASTRAHGGLGLGLAIVRHLVELHGGHVAAESAGEGRGATFTVTLPVRALAPSPGSAAESATQSASLDSALALPSLAGVRALVVDDEVDARDLVAALLEQQGAVVTTAVSARAALQALERDTPDILVSDVGMPGEDGYALIRQVRALGVERGFWFPAIALTAYAQSHDKSRALSAGYQIHLPKPIDAGTLVRTVAELAARSSGR